MKFSIETPEDKKVLEKIMEQQGGIWWEVQKMSEWKIYIIK
jgi:hypothetical protein